MTDLDETVLAEELVSKPAPLPQWLKNMARNWRQMIYMSKMFELVEGIEGDVVECGVGNGDTLGMLAMLVGEERRNARMDAVARGFPPLFPIRKIVGFDSWAGWPAPTTVDSSSFRRPTAGDWKRDRSAALARLKEIGIEKEYPDVDIELVDGFFSETLPRVKAGERSIALLHLDCDLETSYTDCLENLFDLVSPGGVVMFDEVLERSSDLPKDDPVGEKWPGATKAVMHFLAKRGLVGDLNYWPSTKKYYVVKRK